MISAKKKNFIVEYRPTTIRIARVSSFAAPARIEEVLEIDRLKDDCDIGAELRKFGGAKSNGFVHAVCTVYPESRIVRHLLLEASRGKEQAFVLDYLKSQIGVDPSDYSVFCLGANDGIDADLTTFNKKGVLLCGAGREEIQSIQNELVALGIYPSRIEIGSVSTIGVLREYLVRSSDLSPMLHLEIDSKFTTAVILGAKGVEMARRIDGGSDSIATALKEEMNLKDLQAAEKILQSNDFDLGSIAPKILRRILRELQSSIGFFEVQTGLSVSRLYCTNRGRSLNWLSASIGDMLNLSSLNCDFAAWIEEGQLTFGSDDTRSKIDITWTGMFAHLLELKKEKAA